MGREYSLAQNQQALMHFDLITASIKNLGFSYAYIKKAKRLFGEESIFNEFKFDDGHLINLSYTFPILEN